MQAPPAAQEEDVTNGYVPWSTSSMTPCAPSQRSFLPGGELGVQPRARVRDVARELLAALDVRLERLLDRGRLDAVEVREDRVVVREDGPRELPEPLGVDEVRDAEARPVRLRLVRRADAARGRPDVRAAERLLARAVEEGVRRQDDVRAVRDQEVLLDRTPAARRLSISESIARGSITRPLPTTFVTPGRQMPDGIEAEGEVLVAELDGVAGVVAALVAGDEVERGRDEVDDLALALVSPLAADRRRGRSL